VLAEEKSQKIVALVEPQLFAYVDASLIKQAIINLLDNAIKYSAAATVIKIRAAVHDGTALSISVLDQGPGIPSEHHTQIFERFYRVDPSRSRSSGSGAGLGLAISSWIVQLHDGELILDSAPGRGSKFEFVIPTSIQREI
jgi:two-component system phosphate regulon sensor histidine kinase PhoR